MPRKSTGRNPEYVDSTGCTKYLIPSLGPPRGTVGVHVVRLQSENGGELTNEPVIKGCQKRG
eukprot:2270249-Prorocentrum_lima.AAC.1